MAGNRNPVQLAWWMVEMFDKLMEFIKELPGGSARKRDASYSDADPRLAAAALLFRIMDADGETRASERSRLSAMFAQKYDLKGEQLKRLLKAAEKADQESASLSNFTSILKRDLDYQARLDFIVFMWKMVYADGTASEVEVDVMWRIAGLIGISEHDQKNIEAQVHETDGPASVTDS